mmetsp:Transcript_35574/g.92750  ORF Transcript_35574/g.92750 Transcript_35574/m.92750 type:complete len:98 (+) Transcript_35574:2794-3087(+)
MGEPLLSSLVRVEALAFPFSLLHFQTEVEKTELHACARGWPVPPPHFSALSFASMPSEGVRVQKKRGRRERVGVCGCVGVWVCVCVWGGGGTGIERR